MPTQTLCASADLSTKIYCAMCTLCARHHLPTTCWLFCLLLILMLFLCCIQNRSCMSVVKGIVTAFCIRSCIWSDCLDCEASVFEAGFTMVIQSVCYMLIWFIIMLIYVWVTWHAFVTCQVFHILSLIAAVRSGRLSVLSAWCGSCCMSDVNALMTFVLK